jgi:hypothetical protein
MGFVIYNKETGRAEAYYKTESAAKSQVTRNNNQLDYKGQPYPKWAHCSYLEYEGVIQGMSESKWLLWKFFQMGKFGNN